MSSYFQILLHCTLPRKKKFPLNFSWKICFSLKIWAHHRKTSPWQVIKVLQPHGENRKQLNYSRYIYQGYNKKIVCVLRANSHCFFSWVLCDFFISLSPSIFSSARVKNISADLMPVEFISCLDISLLFFVVVLARLPIFIYIWVCEFACLLCKNIFFYNYLFVLFVRWSDDVCLCFFFFIFFFM